jgi:Protein of unknown function (DUF3180)
VALVSTALGWVLLDAWAGRGGEPLPLPWTAPIGTVALALAVIASGLPVRRWLRGTNPRPPNMLMAARTAVLAKAAVYVGAVLAGWYAAQALVVLPRLEGARRTRLVEAAVASLCAVGLALAGWLVQRWCTLPPKDRDADVPPKLPS